MFLSYSQDAERTRLHENASREKNWSRWGPYLSERQWATVREDYSANGDPWSYFPHDHARGRAYRWGEDGLLGITDRECRLCFCLALWNEADPILKERLFGLTGPQGNHGEDVKELYYHLDSTPTHSYFRALYKYPHAEFPYRRLVEENARRGKNDPEFELSDTGIFAEGRYFDPGRCRQRRHRAAVAVHGERDQFPGPVRRPQLHSLRQRRVPQVCRGGKCRRPQPFPLRHQSRGSLHPECPCRRSSHR
ncbi:MAG: hypothetical protein K8R36_04420 [Planctomycetales bacterium]|nr:hypothetical protein [Planctomycetales bacterium]